MDKNEALVLCIIGEGVLNVALTLNNDDDTFKIPYMCIQLNNKSNEPVICYITTYKCRWLFYSSAIKYFIPR